MRQDLANRILKAATARLGEPVTLSRNGTSYALRGIFSETHSEVDIDTGLNVTSQVPTLMINGVDLPIDPKGTTGSPLQTAEPTWSARRGQTVRAGLF